jgi:hypothetical protein
VFDLSEERKTQKSINEFELNSQIFLPLDSLHRNIQRFVFLTICLRGHVSICLLIIILLYSPNLI